MAGDDLVEAPAQSRDVEPPRQANRGREVERRVAGVELVQEPETLLREGERERTSSLAQRAGRDAGGLLRRGSLGLLLQEADRLRQLGRGREGEQVLDGEVDAEDVADPGENLGGEQRVAAELEEVVVDADRLDAEDLLPDAADLLLALVPRRLVGVEQLRPGVERLDRARRHGEDGIRGGLRRGRDESRPYTRSIGGYGESGLFNPVPEALEGVRRQGHPPPLLALLERLPVDALPRQPPLCDLRQRPARISCPENLDRLLPAPARHQPPVLERAPPHLERPGDIGDVQLRMPFQVLGEVPHRLLQPRLAAG